jgi:RNA polymerase sigma-70 factor, ECF subfamily
MDIQSDCGFQVTIPFTSDGDAGQCADHTALSKDQHLVLAAQSGCRKAFNELWDLYSRRIYRTLLVIMKHPQDAEDALQDAFLRAFQAIDSFEGRANFYTWLTRIAINSGLGILRKRRCRPETPLGANPQREEEGPQEDFIDLAPDPEQIYADREEREKLMQAIQRLPPQLRKATQARITENCSVKELACRLNISEAATKSRLHRARIMLGSLTAVRCESKAQITLL